jgi:hypothetical protein
MNARKFATTQPGNSLAAAMTALRDDPAINAAIATLRRKYAQARAERSTIVARVVVITEGRAADGAVVWRTEESLLEQIPIAGTPAANAPGARSESDAPTTHQRS